MINVAHVLKLKNYGGVEVMLLDYLRHSSSYENEVNNYVIAFDLSNDIKKQLVKLKIRFIEVDSNKNKLKQLIKINGFIKKNSIQIVHGHNGFGNLMSRIIGIFKFKLKIVCHEHGSVWDYTVKRDLFEKLTTYVVDIIICNSEASKKMYQIKLNTDNRKLLVINNGIDFNRFPQLPGKKVEKENNKIVIGCVSRLVESKGIDILIETFSKLSLKYNNLELKIIGDGPMKKFLMSRIEALNLIEKVEFIGEINNVHEYLKKIDLFVLPTLRESFGNALLEASYNGVPIVSTYIDGVPEVVKDNESGILIVPTEYEGTKKISYDPIKKIIQNRKRVNFNELFNGIEKLIINKQLRSEMGITGKNYVLNNFSISIYSNKINEIYTNLRGAYK